MIEGYIYLIVIKPRLLSKEIRDIKIWNISIIKENKKRMSLYKIISFAENKFGLQNKIWFTV